MKKLTIIEARNYLINYHFLNQENQLFGYQGIKTVFERLRSIQYDPLNVVGNNLDLVLQSRVDDYQLGMVNDLLYKKRYLIDGFDKMMSVFLTEDFPKFRQIRENLSSERLRAFKHHLGLEELDLINPVLELIKTEGPLFAKDLSLGKKVNHQWGSTKETTLTLDYLFHNGDINVSNRKNNQKQYTLTENLIGDLAKQDDGFKTQEEFILWFLFRRIKEMGLVWNKSSVVWSGLYISNKSTRTKYLKKLIEQGLITEVKISDISESFYVITDQMHNLNPPKNTIRFIAPLDNLIWDRELIKNIFEFDYTWEVYVPKNKRKYGYYVLPILYGNRFIGRIEFDKYHKKAGLEVKQTWFETQPDSNIDKALNQALKRFEKYLK